MKLTNRQLNKLGADAAAIRTAVGLEPATARPNTRLELFSAIAKANPKKYHIYAEGDSWFAYPRQWIIVGADSNVIQWLNENDDMVILNRASSGDEVETMISGDQKLEMFKTLNTQAFDVLLFSGGGNDIVGAYDFDFFLKQWDAANFTKPEDCVNQERFTRRLERIEDAYRDMVELTQEFSVNKKIKIVTHIYDWALPNPQGASFLGGLFQYDGGQSWMYPYLKAKGYYAADPANPMATAVVKYMLTAFADRLNKVQTDYPDVFHVTETQGTLKPNEWLNEIHPTPDGFKKIAGLVYDKIVEVVP